MARKPIHPIDAHVGNRIKMRRNLRGFSQNAMGDYLGLTFQQVQKYEKGMNRVSASKLFLLANYLGCHVSYFFEGMSRETLMAAGFDCGQEPQETPDDMLEIMAAKDIQKAARAMAYMPPINRRAVVQFIEAAANAADPVAHAMDGGE